MSDFGKLLEQMLKSGDGPQVKLITASSEEELSRKIKQAVSDTNCGEDDCPVHAGIISPEELQGLDAEAALDLAVAAGAGANNSMHRNKPGLSSERRQLAEMWMMIHHALADREDQKGADDDELASLREHMRQTLLANRQLQAEVADLRAKLEVAEDQLLAAREEHEDSE